jgi:hypothetical protein
MWRLHGLIKTLSNFETWNQGIWGIIGNGLPSLENRVVNTANEGWMQFWRVSECCNTNPSMGWDQPPSHTCAFPVSDYPSDTVISSGTRTFRSRSRPGYPQEFHYIDITLTSNKFDRQEFGLGVWRDRTTSNMRV